MAASNKISLTVVQSTNELARDKNVILVSTRTFRDFQAAAEQLPLVCGRQTRYALVEGAESIPMVFTLSHDRTMADGTLALFFDQRHCTRISFNDRVQISPCAEELFLEKVTFMIKPKVKQTQLRTLDTELLRKKVLDILRNQYLTERQEIPMPLHEVNYILTVHELVVVAAPPTPRGRERSRGSVSSAGDDAAPPTPVASSAMESDHGILVEATSIKFDTNAENVKPTGPHVPNSDCDVEPLLDYKTIEIGGMDEQLTKIFRTAFLSRQVPRDIVDQHGTRHAKGMLLYGPPGTGKTLIARQLARMMKAREPKIVNGPDLLAGLVGKTEENVRNLFKEAEADYARLGDRSPLHMIVFDEIDAICRARGTTSGDTGVRDSLVNQLLTKIDGVNQLNNIFIIGMTNRPDMLDPALTRAGRLELQVEISLPSEDGRFDILEIHTKTMKAHKALGVDERFLRQLAAMTPNFTGSELQQLVKVASDFSLVRLKHECDARKIKVEDAARPWVVLAKDFEDALREVKPQHGRKDANALADAVRGGIVETGRAFSSFMSVARIHLQTMSVESSTQPMLTLLLQGIPQSGKTTLSASLAQEVNFPFARLISPTVLLRHTDLGKADYINEAFSDAYKSLLSVIVIDDVELILDYVPVGQRFSSAVYTTLMARLRQPPPAGHRLLVIATTSRSDVLETIGLGRCFDWTLEIPVLTTGSEVQAVLDDIKTDPKTNTRAPLVPRADVERVVRAFDETMRLKRRPGIPVKKLYKAVDFAKQARGASLGATLCDLLECSLSASDAPPADTTLL